jgi:hypothetical protein
MFHQHDFKVVARTYAEALPLEHRINAEPETILTLRMGVTTHLLACACGDTNTIRMLGREDRGVMDIKFSEVKR